MPNKAKISFKTGFLIALLSSLLVIILLYLTNSWIGIQGFSNFFTLPIYAIIPGALVALSILAFTRSDRIEEISKRSLFFLILSFSSTFAAEQTWNLYDHVLDIDPYPSIADVFYVAAPLFMFVALVLFLRPLRYEIRKKTVIFAVTISFVILIPSLIITFNAGIEDNPIEIFVALIYPIVGSLLLVPSIIAILFSVRGKKNFFWLMILSGIIIINSADTFFLFLVLGDGYTDGHLIDIMWISGYTIWAFMMYFLIHNSKKNTQLNPDTDNIYHNYKMEKFQKYGVQITLVLVNVSIGILLISMNYLSGDNSDNSNTLYFSYLLITTTIIFSIIILFLNSKLNKTLEHRTEKLEKISDELIKAERFSAIGELSSRLAHDLRNPLSVIVSSNFMIKNSPKNEIISENTARIERASGRINHQINNVLDFVNTRPSTPERISLQKLFELSLEDIEIPEKIIVEKPSDNPILTCDSHQISIVLNNVILNAIQALKNEGKINIVYEIDNEYHIIKIQNSGDPIPEQILEKIFDPLFTTKQEGTGLGLTSCKQIIEQHNGEILVTNHPTTFTIKIPRSDN